MTKKQKIILTIQIILAVIVVGVMGYFVMKTASKDPTPEKYLHTSENGVETMDTGYMRSKLTSLNIVDLMGNGINLGNTMEAYGRNSLGLNADISSYETFWGQPVTTQEIIDSMKEAGFDSLRITVAWTNTMDFENGDYTIREDYLDRVEEIINYALNADMYVVINDHWDGSWWGMFGSAKQETRDAAMELYVSMWTQIAKRYEEYSDYLIFESANEELGDRLNDIDISPDSGTLSKDECYEMTNRINQTFVDTVRGTGGNNTQRFLLIAGYNTDIAATLDDRFIMPTDTANHKLILSVHYYTPWGFCGNQSLSFWGTIRHYNEQNDLLSSMTKFTEMGYGVIIGEYAVALSDDGSVKSNTCDFLENFLNNCDQYGYCPMLWDCSSLFIRRDLGFFDDDVADVFSRHSLTAQSTMTYEEITSAAEAAIAAALAAAKDTPDSTEAPTADTATAWIMFNSGDWNVMYSVGDTYDPVSKTDGLVASDVAITGAGTYTVGLDFTGTGTGVANSTAFSALAVSNGETLFPGYIITITDLQINGESYSLTGRPYTTSDDGKCTRVNIYNEWVTVIPDDARTANGNLTGVSAMIVDATELGDISTLVITFDYGPA